MGDHTETIEIDFDPTLICFEQIMEVFWENHHPSRRRGYGGRQYMSLLLYHNEIQKNEALQIKRKWEKIRGEVIPTEIKSYTQFFLAEEKHQKYYLKRYKTAYEAVRELFTTHDQFVQSTLIARLNGFVREFGTLSDLKSEIETWGLSKSDQIRILETLNLLKW